jgi:hypothetical protein
MRRYRLIVCLIALITFVPATAIVAAPPPREPETRLERVIRFVKRLVAKIDSRITIPIGELPPPEDPPPPTP